MSLQSSSLQPLPTSYSNRQNDQGSNKNLEIIRKPRQRIQIIIKTEAQTVDMLTKSTKLQYSSFENKHVVSGKIMDYFKSLDDQLIGTLSEMYTIENGDQSIRSKILAKHIESPYAIEERNQSNSLSEKKNKKVVKQGKNQIKTFQRSSGKNESNKTLEKKQAFKRSRVVELKQSRRMKQESQSGDEENEESEEDVEFKEVVVKRMPINKVKKGSNDCKQMFFSGPERYQETRTLIQKKIENKMKIFNQFNKIGELLLLPYSTVQLLLDYNESAEYPLQR